MKYRNTDLEQNGYLNGIAQRWSRRMASRLRDNKEKGPWVGKGPSVFATKLHAKLTELIASGGQASDDPEAVCEAAADIAVLAHMFCDVVLDETAPAREEKAAERRDKAIADAASNRSASVAAHLTASRAERAGQPNPTVDALGEEGGD